MKKPLSTDPSYSAFSSCRYSPYGRNGYFPQWIHHWGWSRVGQPEHHGESCSHVPDRVTFLGTAIYDFNQACKVDDYLADLGLASRLNYPNVSQNRSDSVMRGLMYHDCVNRGVWAPTCYSRATLFYAAVSACIYSATEKADI